MQDDFRNKLIADHLEMAAAIASDCVTKYKLTTLLPYADVLGYAHQGLVEAANRYSPASGTKFRSYSWSRIRGAVIDGVRKSSRHGYSRTHGAPDHDIPEGPAPRRTADQDVESLKDESSVRTSPEDRLDATRLRATLLEAIQNLPSKQRDITLRHYYRGEDLVDISKDYGFSDDYIGRLHSRSIRQLRDKLTESLRDHLDGGGAQ